MTSETLILIQRRALLGGGVAIVGGLLGCPGRNETSGGGANHPAPPLAPAPSTIVVPQPVVGAAPASCTATVEQILGPYYLPEAPWRDSLLEPGMQGERLAIDGTVRALDCSPIAGALLEVWQADHGGRYDVRGPMLRARLQSDRAGQYRIHTILPGRYLNGAQYRPAHVHLRISAPGHTALVTQLYFEGDPYNDVDPFLDRSLIRPVQQAPDEKRVGFDVTLA